MDTSAARRLFLFGLGQCAKNGSQAAARLILDNGFADAQRLGNHLLAQALDPAHDEDTAGTIGQLCERRLYPG